MVVDYLSMSSVNFGRGHLCMAPFARRVPQPFVYCKSLPEIVEGMGGDAGGATFVRSTLPVVYAVVAPALAKNARAGHPAIGI
jgi:hypothetical protein